MDNGTMPPSERATVRGRTARRSTYDRAVIDSILDEGVVCHVGFVQDEDPFVVPMSYARAGDKLYFHGGRGGRIMRVLTSGEPVCLEVTIVDGIVLGRSPVYHGMNYRSVVLFGRGREVTGDDEKVVALKAIMEHIAPGRWADVRAPTEGEVAATLIAAVRTDEASAKIRSGPPAEEDGGASPGLWAGVLPLRLSALEPVPAPAQTAEVPFPGYLADYRRGSSGSQGG
ncbi:MAG: pyridoxamine 5'-phosphate oxidase family protein [Chloroflexi bacterium]|nr:pyridoxamine 5'-phosphate oxidase family protein [Chloroflexota bacterium]